MEWTRGAGWTSSTTSLETAPLTHAHVLTTHTDKQTCTPTRRQTRTHAPGGPYVLPLLLSTFASMFACTSLELVRLEKFTLRTLFFSALRPARKFWTVTVFAVPDSPTKRTGFSMAPRRESRLE